MGGLSPPQQLMYSNALILHTAHCVYGSRAARRGSTGSYLHAKYFAVIIAEANNAPHRAVIGQCSESVSDWHHFTSSLIVYAVQMHGIVKLCS